MSIIWAFARHSLHNATPKKLWLFIQFHCHFTFCSSNNNSVSWGNSFLYGEAIGCKDWIINPCFIFHVIKSAIEKKYVSWHTIQGKLAFLITVHYFNNSINLWQLEHLRMLSQLLSSAFATNRGRESARERQRETKMREWREKKSG